MEELKSLAATAGAEVLDCIVQARAELDAATLIGAGKVAEIGALVRASNANLVIFDRDLSPTQQRNLEQAFGVKVLDRTQLILDIFASRARTREGQLQVELAQLNYLLPRLTGRGVEMSRLGGGIGTRGPGETQLETDRRKIYRRIRKIEIELEAVRAARQIQRRQRSEAALPTLALVGYTNAGKSTLFNRLTGAGVVADARLFATLDPTVRRLTLPSRRQVLVSDTVGFIRGLPTTLVKAFRATLEEVREAAMLIHVVDLASAQAAAHTAQVEEVLRQIGAAAIPQVLALNKCDLLPPEEIPAAVARIRGQSASCAPAVPISAQTGHGVAELLEAVDRGLSADPLVETRFLFPPGEGAKARLVHEAARVTEVRYDDKGCLITAETPASLRQRLKEFVVQ